MADIITDSNGRINNNIPKKLFRLSTENKNLLAKAGSLYYGTGETEEVTITTENGTQSYQIPVTKAIEPPEGGIKNGVLYGINFVYNTTNQTITSARFVQIAAPTPVFPLVGGKTHWVSDMSGETETWEKEDGAYNIQTVNFTFGYNQENYQGMYWYDADGTTYQLWYMKGTTPNPDPEHTDQDILIASYGDGLWAWENAAYQTATLSFATQVVSKGFYNYVSQYMTMA